MQIQVTTIHIDTILHPWNLIAWLLVGLIAGGLAGMLVRGRGFGCLGDIVVGLVGSFIGAIIASAFNWGSFGFLGTILVSLLGAVILVMLLEFLKGRR